MSFKRNILANYVSQIYVTLIGIIMLPLYMHYIGMETYGLVGFFAMLQAWFNLPDMGLTPTMAPETARFNCEATDALSLRRLLRAMEEALMVIPLHRECAQIDELVRLPDESTVLRFRHRLENHKLADLVLATVNEILSQLDSRLQAVTLNPERDWVIKAYSSNNDIQQLAA